jgi:hypothetical protein
MQKKQQNSTIGQSDESRYCFHLYTALDPRTCYSISYRFCSCHYQNIRMQKIERRGSWNHKSRLHSNSHISSMNRIASSTCALDATPYLTCTIKQACPSNEYTEATFYCVECNTLQCIQCEKTIHGRTNEFNHQRLNLDEIKDEHCSMDRNHAAVLYCSTCASSYCYQCYEQQHVDRQDHRPQKFRKEQMINMDKQR